LFGDTFTNNGTSINIWAAHLSVIARVFVRTNTGVANVISAWVAIIATSLIGGVYAGGDKVSAIGTFCSIYSAWVSIIAYQRNSLALAICNVTNHWEASISGAFDEIEYASTI